MSGVKNSLRFCFELNSQTIFRGCDKGECVAPEICKCSGNLKLDITGTQCVGSCEKSCLNGVCSGWVVNRWKPSCTHNLNTLYTFIDQTSAPAKLDISVIITISLDAYHDVNQSAWTQFARLQIFVCVIPAMWKTELLLETSNALKTKAWTLTLNYEYSLKR